MAQLRSQAVARTNNPATAKTGGKSGLRALTTTPAPQGYPGSITTTSGLWPLRLRPKLTVSDPGDRCEQEADRVADQVMRLPDPAVAKSGIDPAPIRPLATQRLCLECEDGLHRQIQTPRTETQGNGLDTVAATLRQGGRPLDTATRGFFEPRFGVDFSAVRIHTDTQAAASAKSINALAYTVGRDVVFNSGQYAPQRDSGKRLLAHELTHVVQQRAVQTSVIQRAPAPPPAKVPTLTAPQTATFFTDLNAALTTVLAVKANLGPSDFIFKGGADFAAYIKQTSELSGDYIAAEEQATEVCAATTPKAVAALCGTDKQCPQDIKRTQSNPKLCRGAKATDEFVSWFITTRGVTSPAGGPSVVIEETTQNAMLLDIVHEGVHRLRGATWKQRCRIGAGYTHARIKPPVRLAHIGRDLDEGTAQIITDLVISELQKVRGRSWLKGYASTAYAGAVAKVNKMLADHGKDVGFLKRAYTATTSVSEVEDLQYWQ